MISGCCEMISCRCEMISGRCEMISCRCKIISGRCELCVFQCNVQNCRCVNALCRGNKEPSATQQAFRPLHCEIAWVLSDDLAAGSPAPRLPGFFHAGIYAFSGFIDIPLSLRDCPCRLHRCQCLTKRLLSFSDIKTFKHLIILEQYF